MPRDGLRKDLFLFWIRRINALLHDAAAVHVTGYLRAIGYHFLINELLVDRFPRAEDLLNHVIPVDLAGQGDKLARKILREKPLVGRVRQHFNNLLD